MKFLLTIYNDESRWAQMQPWHAAMRELVETGKLSGEEE